MNRSGAGLVRWSAPRKEGAGVGQDELAGNAAGQVTDQEHHETGQFVVRNARLRGHYAAELHLADVFATRREAEAHCATGESVLSLADARKLDAFPVRGDTPAGVEDEESGKRWWVRSDQTESGWRQLMWKDLTREKLTWTESAIERLAERWKTHPHLGARYLTTLVRVQILDPLNVAAASGELGDDIREIVLDGEAPKAGRPPRGERRHEGDKLRIVLR